MPLPSPLAALWPPPLLLLLSRLGASSDIGKGWERLPRYSLVVARASLAAFNASQAFQPSSIRSIQLPVTRPLLKERQVPANAEVSREVGAEGTV